MKLLSDVELSVRNFIRLNSWNLLIGLLVLTFSSPVQSDELPDGGTLYRRAAEVTDWIDDADSVRMEVAMRFHHTPEAIAARKARYSREEGDRFDPNHPYFARQLRPEESGELLLAWDRKRIVSRTEVEGSMRDKAVWADGRGYYELAFTGSQSSPIALTDRPPNDVTQRFFIWLPWSQTGFHPAPWKQLWRGNKPMRDAFERSYGKQVAWKCRGKVEFDGVSCWLVHRGIVGDWTRFYIECDTGRFRGVRDGTWGIEFGKATRPLLVRELRARHFPDVDEESVERLMNELPVETRLEIQEKCADEVARTYDEVLPQIEAIWEIVLSDYREVAPGKHFPMRQTMTTGTTVEDKPLIDESREFDVTRLSVGENLNDELFAWSIPEGTEVYDTTRDVPIRYRHDSKRTDAEWEALFAEAREKRARDEDRIAPVKALVGKPALAWPEGLVWMNSDPLTWEGLLGRWVVLDFWDIGCGPCWGNQGLPFAEAVHRNERESERPQDRLIIISIHRAGRTAQQIRAAVTERMKADLHAPVVIDQEGSEAGDEPLEGFTGHLFRAYAVPQMPFAILIDPEGLVVDFGDLQEMHSLARKGRTKRMTD